MCKLDWVTRVEKMASSGSFASRYYRSYQHREPVSTVFCFDAAQNIVTFSRLDAVLKFWRVDDAKQSMTEAIHHSSSATHKNNTQSPKNDNSKDKTNGADNTVAVLTLTEPKNDPLLSVIMHRQFRCGVKGMKSSFITRGKLIYIFGIGHCVRFG